MKWNQAVGNPADMIILRVVELAESEWRLLVGMILTVVFCVVWLCGCML